MGLTGKEFHLKLERKPGRLIKTHHTHLKIVRADAPNSVDCCIKLMIYLEELRVTNLL